MKINEIWIRDPYVLLHDNIYYLYGTTGKYAWQGGENFNVYTSDDLVNFSEPHQAFKKTDDFWGTKNFWAPEVHYYKGKFYMFASFKADDICRGTQVLVSDSPMGPFVEHSYRAITPHDCECLDGTLYIENEIPYIVYCHEWLQIKNGTICYQQLSEDLKETVTESKVMFKATDASWVAYKEDGNYITDGPFLYRTKTGKLFMLWSSFSDEGYSIGLCYSDNDKIDGNWIHVDTPLFKKDGGHGMLFMTKDNKLMLTIHCPNEHPHERPVFIEIVDDGDMLRVK